MIDSELLKEKIEKSGYRFSWIAKQLNLSPFGMRKKLIVKLNLKYQRLKKYQNF